jgi:hypothetical protein
MDEVLWTSFEHHTPLDSGLDAAGAVFGPLLEARGVHWAAITDRAERRERILDELARVPVLWVWDNVEPVTGFPAGTPSAWTADEQAELREFLRDLQKKTRAKVLLTSRRDEHAWLGDLPRRVRLARACSSPTRWSAVSPAPRAATRSTGTVCCGSPAATH